MRIYPEASEVINNLEKKEDFRKINDITHPILKGIDFNSILNNPNLQKTFEIEEAMTLPDTLFQDHGFFYGLRSKETREQAIIQMNTTKQTEKEAQNINLKEHENLNQVLKDYCIENDRATGDKMKALDSICEQSDLACLSYEARANYPGLKKLHLNFADTLRDSFSPPLKKQMRHKPIKFAPKEELKPKLVYTLDFCPPNCAPHRRFQQIVISENCTLLDLLNQVKCPQDIFPMKVKEIVPEVHEFSFDLGKRVSELVRDDSSNPSYFYIEKVIYVDTRSSRDYSVPLLRWSAAINDGEDDPQVDFKGLTRGNYETKLKDINFRLNQPYLFCHRGRCQHLFMVSKIHVYNSEADGSLTQFPKTTYLGKSNSFRCNFCSFKEVVHATVNDYISGDCPAYFCDPCFQSFHFDNEGKPLFHFKHFKM